MRIEFVLPEPGCQPVTTTAIPPELISNGHSKVFFERGEIRDQDFLALKSTLGIQ